MFVRKKVENSNGRSESEGAQNGTAPEEFELDLVAVLGYQVVVISCTTSSEHGALLEKKPWKHISEQNNLAAMKRV